MEHGEMRQCRKPRVVVVGAGMAGLSAARRLRSVRKYADFELIILEGSHRTGGRICTSEFGGERVELGATWIHGIEGSPLYEIAEQSGALKGDMPWECMDGFPTRPIVKAEGGYVVDEVVVEPAVRLYKKIIREAQSQKENQQNKSPTNEAFSRTSNLGAYLKRRFNDHLSQMEQASKNGSAASQANGSLAKANGVIAQEEPSPIRSSWSMRSLLEGIFSIHENSERSETAADSLYDLDLLSFGEYWEFPGKQITIAKGFSSLISFLSSSLPPGMIQFGKIVEAIHWTDSQNCCGPPVRLHCRDGSTIEADHVIITVSLGVLKAGMPAFTYSSEILQASSNIKTLKARENRVELFQPPLPPWKNDAINRLGFGVVDKVFTLIQPPQGGSHNHMQFIYKSIMNDDQRKSTIPSWMRKTSSVYPIHSKSHVLLAWFAGKEALKMEALSDDTIANAIASTLSEFGFCQTPTNLFGHGESRETCQQVTLQNGADNDHAATSSGFRVKKTSTSNGYRSHCNIKHSRWGTNPLFWGSYSYVATGSSGADIDILAEPIPREIDHKNSNKNVPALQILFAGEATHRYHYSTTHGAYFSGMREADRLLHYYGWLA